MGFRLWAQLIPITHHPTPNTQLERCRAAIPASLQGVNQVKFARVCFIIAVLLLCALVGLIVPAFGQAPGPVGEPGPGPKDIARIPTIAELTPALIAAITSGLISLAFRFVPSLRTWFDQHTPETKQAFMLIATLVVGSMMGMAAIAKYGFTEEGLILLGLTIYAALSSNQVTYQFIK
jgi:hypothetical protein